jgi:Zn-dependent protease with chaperone function
MRVLCALVLLVAFPVVVIALVAGFLALAVWSLSTDAPELARAPALFGTVLAVVLCVAVVTLLRAHRPPEAVVVAPEAEPGLWALVNEVAATVGTRPPDRVRLVAEPNAWVFTARGVRHVDVGLPLLVVLDTGQLRAVLAHEMAHHRGGHVPFAATVHRGHELMTGVVDGLTRSPARALLRAHLWLYWLVASRVLRDHEREADRVAVAATDPATLGSALLTITRSTAAWQDYVDALSRAGAAPTGVCDGFRAFSRSAAGVAALAGAEPSSTAARGDSHPPMAERIAVLGPLGGPRSAADATELITRWERVSRRIDDLLFPAAGRPRVPAVRCLLDAGWNETRRAARRLFRAAEGLGGAGGTGGVLDLLAAGRGPELAGRVVRANPVDPSSSAPARALVAHVASALEVAVVRAGGRRLYDDLGPHLLDTAGAVVDTAALAREAVEGPPGVERARAVLPPAGAAPPPETGPEPVAPLGAMIGVDANGRPFVLIVLETGLALLPTTFDDPSAGPLVERIWSSRTLPDTTWFVPYEDVVTARSASARRMRLRLELRDGTGLVLRETGVTSRLALSARDPRLLLTHLTGVLEGVGHGEPRRGLPPATPVAAGPPPTGHTAGTRAVSRARRTTGLLFCLSAVPLALAASAGAGTGALTAAIVSGSSGLLWVLIDVGTGPESTTRRSLGFLGSGGLFLVLGVVALFRLPPSSSGLSSGVLVAGAGLCALGVHRRRGRWPRVTGNGFLVAALLTGCVGLGTSADLLLRGRPPAVLLILLPVPVLAVVGVLVKRAALRSPHRAAFGPAAVLPSKPTSVGAVALLAAPTGPLGAVFAVWAIVEARRAGVRPVLGVTALVVAVLVMTVVVLVASS